MASATGSVERWRGSTYLNGLPYPRTHSPERSTSSPASPPMDPWRRPAVEYSCGTSSWPLRIIPRHDRGIIKFGAAAEVPCPWRIFAKRMDLLAWIAQIELNPPDTRPSVMDRTIKPHTEPVKGHAIRSIPPLSWRNHLLPSLKVQNPRPLPKRLPRGGRFAAHYPVILSP